MTKEEIEKWRAEMSAKNSKLRAEGDAQFAELIRKLDIFIATMDAQYKAIKVMLAVVMVAVIAAAIIG